MLTERNFNVIMFAITRDAVRFQNIPKQTTSKLKIIIKS